MNDLISLRLLCNFHKVRFEYEAKLLAKGNPMAEQHLAYQN